MIIPWYFLDFQKHLAANSLQLVYQIFSLVGREMSNVNSFVR